MRKIFNIFTTLFLVGIIAYCGYQIYIQYNEYKIGENIYHEVEDKYILNSTNNNDNNDNSNNDTALSNFLVPEYEDTEYLNIDWAELEKLNSDIIAWIYCPNTQLNYPVLKSKDNEDYLHKTVTGTINSAGSIFLDYHNDSNLLDYVSILYGHNMKNGSMFKTVNRYKKEEWYKEHPTIQIYTKEKQEIYNIVAIIDTKSDSDIYSPFINEKNKYMDYLDIWANKSIYKTGIKYDYNKRTILLSTCNGQVGGPNRIVVVLQPQSNNQEKNIMYFN